MSAAALRAPARWWDALRAEMAILASVRPYGWVCLFLLTAIIGADGFYNGGNRPPFETYRDAVAFMFLLPLAWQGRGGRQQFVPLPINDAGREVIRVFWGAACAGAVLGLGLALHVCLAYSQLFGDEDTAAAFAVFPRGYPVALTLTGVAYYLFGAALALRTQRPGRTLAAAYCLVVLAILVSGAQLERLEFVEEGGDPERFSGGSSLTLPVALVRLALGAAAVGVSAWLGGLRGVEWPRRMRSRVRRAGVARTAPPRAAAAVPRKPASAWRIGMHQLALLAPRMVLPLLGALYLAWRSRQIETTTDSVSFGSGGTYGWIMTAGFLWPVLVWMDERNAGDWDEAQPTGTVSRRLLHAAAGFSWLLLFVLIDVAGGVWGAMTVGTLRSPIDLPAWVWLGLPLATLALYGFGSVLAVLGDRPLLSGILGGITLALVVLAAESLFGNFNIAVDDTPGPLSIMRLLAPVGWIDTEHWSAAPALLWTSLAVLAATGAIRRRARQEQSHGAPEAREPKLFGWPLGTWHRLQYRIRFPRNSPSARQRP